MSGLPRLTLLLLAALTLSACADRRVDADRLAAPAKLVRSEVAAGHFRITAFTRLSDAQSPVTVYIEGDGMAWQTRSRPSSDPTPTQPLALRLAALDPSANVIYLARPCQYTKGDSACRVAYWTDRRFSEEVVASLNTAIDLINRSGSGPVHLVGYSGGGAVAALIAARRGDVASLRTVAGNLDHHALNRHHKVSAMTGSLNARDVARSLAALPQEHFVGTKDKVVPPFIAQAFVDALGSTRCARVITITGATHSSGWIEAWPKALARQPLCSDRL